MKICIACSAGGHLTEALGLLPIIKKRKYFILTMKRADTKELNRKNVRFITDFGRNPLKLILNLIESFSVFLSERPDVIITTGAGMALPICYIAKLFGKKVIFIESFCRINKPSLSGKVAYPISDLFLVQWKQILKKYGKKAKYWGSVI